MSPKIRLSKLFKAVFMAVIVGLMLYIASLGSCLLGGLAFGKDAFCIPLEQGSHILTKSRDTVYFHYIQTKITTQTADAVDIFLYARMTATEKSFLQSAQKRHPDIPGAELPSFYLQKAMDMGSREAAAAYADGLANRGIQEMIHGSADAGHGLYARGLEQTEQLIRQSCTINSDVDISSDFHRYRSRMGKVDRHLLDELFYVLRSIEDPPNYYPYHPDNVKHVMLIQLYSETRCKHISRNYSIMPYFIPEDYGEFKERNDERKRLLLYALEAVRGRSLKLPKAVNAQDRREEAELKKQAGDLAAAFLSRFGQP